MTTFEAAELNSRLDTIIGLLHRMTAVAAGEAVDRGRQQFDRPDRSGEQIAAQRIADERKREQLHGSMLDCLDAVELAALDEQILCGAFEKRLAAIDPNSYWLRQMRLRQIERLRDS